MPAMEAPAMRVLEGTALRRATALEEAYQVFRLERQGNLVAARTLEFYDWRVGEFIGWLRREAPTVERVDDIDVNHLRAFRAFLDTTTSTRSGVSNIIIDPKA
jgi:hypothetical protein